VEGALSTLFNFLYPEKFSEQSKKITPGWDNALRKKLKQIAQKKKVPQEAAKKAKEDKWIKEHPPKAFLTIPRAKVPPLIDGRLDDRAWENIPGTTPFTHYKEHAFSEVMTFVRACYDRDNLYIGFHCFEPEIKKIKAKITEHDRGVWADDSVEVFISPREDKREDYYHFIFNTLGTKYDAFKLDKNWNGSWKGKAFLGEKEWEAEIAIPFRTLGLRGAKLGRIFPINFNRSRYVNDSEYSNWSYTDGAFHRPDRFGEVKLGRDIPFIKKIWWDTPFGHVTLFATIKNPLEVRKDLELKLVTEKIKEPLREESSIGKGEEKEFNFSFELADSVSSNVQVSLYEKGRDLLFYATPYLPLEPEKAFIRSWLICGPFPNPGGRKQGETVEDLRKIGCKGFDEDFLISQGGEINVEPRKRLWQVYSGRVGDKKIYKCRWQVKESLQSMIDFYKQLEPYEYIVIYAACYIISDQDKDALIKLGSDDGYKLWVNHEFIGQDHIHRGSAPDQNIHQVKLKKGGNIILIKIDQDFGGVNFYLRLTDLKGKSLSGIRLALDSERFD